MYAATSCRQGRVGLAVGPAVAVAWLEHDGELEGCARGSQKERRLIVLCRGFEFQVVNVNEPMKSFEQTSPLRFMK